jgi:16S rRNA (uracil1498-N3)-methyltransferase
VSERIDFVFFTIHVILFFSPFQEVNMRYHTIVLPHTTAAVGDIIALGATHQHHLQVVLRKKLGDHIILACPSGYFVAQLVVTDRHGPLAATIIEKQDRTTQSPLHIHLFQGICQPKKMDWITQKTTELGIHAITPLHTERTQQKADRHANKIERLRTIAENACEQAQRNIVPSIYPVAHLTDMIPPPEACNLVLVPDAQDTIADIEKPARDINLIIGPEGGLSTAEITTLVAHNWRPIRFGPRILRTETAAIALTAAIGALWGDCK